MKSHTLFYVWLAGSLITLYYVSKLWNDGKRDAAVALTIASPFPCPTGLPC